jgi:hypothetical protein
MHRKRRRTAIVAAAAALGLFALIWFLVAVIVPIAEQAECAGIEFRAPVDAQPPTERQRPPIGGEGGIAGRLRRALRGDTPAVYCDDFADPFVLRVGNDYYAYSTNTGDALIPVLTSSGIFGTGNRSEALAQIAGWSTPGKVWAPAVLSGPDGFVLYYATRTQNPDRQCLSVAVASRPKGPFIDGSEGPLVCPDGGAIDASPFVAADGRAFLLWKHEGETTGIVAQELAPDGLSLIGPRQLLLVDDQPWEGGLIEAPSMVGFEGRYYLFYSANDWASANYAVGYAVCESPLGPCTKAPGPWLTSSEKAEGPGGQEIFTDDEGQFWMALHAWVRGKVGYPDGARNLFVLRLDFANGVPIAS